MNPLELRKIILIGYSHDAPVGAQLLDAQGLPINPALHRVRMRVALWIPQKLPLRRRDVGTLEEYLRVVVAERQPVGEAHSLHERKVPLGEYMRLHRLHDYLQNIQSQPKGYTLVADAKPFELAALRDGAIEEQIQDFTFDRQPTIEELRSHIMPHWETRTLNILGYLPNSPPEDHNPAPKVVFEAVVQE